MQNRNTPNPHNFYLNITYNSCSYFIEATSDIHKKDTFFLTYSVLIKYKLIVSGITLSRVIPDCIILLYYINFHQKFRSIKYV